MMPAFDLKVPRTNQLGCKGKEKVGREWRQARHQVTWRSRGPIYLVPTLTTGNALETTVHNN